MNDGRLRDRIRRANQAECTPFNDDFLVTEFEQVALRSGAHTWDEYREAPRRGRGKALSVRDRKVVWSVLGRVLEDLREVGELPWSMICRAAREHLEAGRTVSPYDAVLVDELQDLDPEGIRLVAALCRDSTQLMLVGDAGQRIFAGAFTLKQLGVDVRGRSRTLRINYRTTEQIRRAADALLATECDDMDGGAQSRRARSLIAGPEPEVRGFATDAEQAAFLVGRVKTLREKGLGFAEIGVFAPFNEQRDAIAEALRAAGIPAVRLGPNDDLAGNEAVRVGTMHRAKGLEFKTVFATHCSRGVIPAPYVSKIEDPADREAAEAQQRQLLYVVMTRARDELVMSFVGRASPLLGSEIHSVSSEAIIQPTGSTP